MIDMRELLKTRVDNMLDLYLKIEKQFKWQHNLSKHFAALIYTQKNKSFDKEKINRLIKVIKESTGVFSPYRGNSMFILAMLLCSEYDDPKEKFLKMLEYDKKLRNAGFKNSTYLPIANYALLITCEDSDVENRVKRGYDIYREMKNNHPWITSGDDYPLTILLAGFNNSIETIEEYYQGLNRLGFSKGNGLQLLSHILSFSSENKEVVIRRCKNVYEKLKENKLKLYPSFYSSLGLIALLSGDNDEIIKELIEVAGYINSLKKYKWLGKGMNVLIASAIISNDYISKQREQNNLIETTIGLSIETLIAAQTSAVIAGVTAASVAASTSS